MRIKWSNLIKAVTDRSKLMLVEVSVNTKHGVHRSHRWKKPLSAMNEVKKEYKRQGVKDPSKVQYVSKDGKNHSEKEIIEAYMQGDKKQTIQSFIQHNYKIESGHKSKTVNQQAKTKAESQNKENGTQQTSEARRESSAEEILNNRAEQIAGGIYGITKGSQKDCVNIDFKVGDKAYHMSNADVQKDISEFSMENPEDKERILYIIKVALEAGHFKEGPEISPYTEGADSTQRMRSINKQKEDILKDKIIEPTNDWKVVKTRDEYVSALTKLSDYEPVEFTRASMDMLDLNIPLIVGRSQGVKGNATYTINSQGDVIPKDVGIATNTISSKHQGQKTAVHECMHHRSTLAFGETREKAIEESLVEVSAIYAVEQMGKSIRGGEVLPAYPRFVIGMMPIMKSIPAFSSCNTFSDFGQVAMNMFMTVDTGLHEAIHTRYNEIGLVTDGKESYYDRYIPNDLAQRTAVLEKHEQRVYNTIEASGETKMIEGMAVLISALKSGSIDLTTALNSGTYGDLPFILLACIMDEEGIDELGPELL